MGDGAVSVGNAALLGGGASRANWGEPENACPTNHMRPTEGGAFILPSVGRVACAPSPHCQTRDTMRNHANHAQAGHCGLRSGNLRTNRSSSCDRVIVGCAPNSLDSCNRSASAVLEPVLVE